MRGLHRFRSSERRKRRLRPGDGVPATGDRSKTWRHALRFGRVLSAREMYVRAPPHVCDMVSVASDAPEVWQARVGHCIRGTLEDIHDTQGHPWRHRIPRHSSRGPVVRRRSALIVGVLLSSERGSQPMGIHARRVYVRDTHYRALYQLCGMVHGVLTYNWCTTAGRTLSLVERSWYRVMCRSAPKNRRIASSLGGSRHTCNMDVLDYVRSSGDNDSKTHGSLR